jgi:hypothetical protein
MNKMSSLYNKLAQLGFDKSFVQDFVLPDWWCIEFEQTEGAFIEAAAYASRKLNLDLDSLLDQLNG